MKMYIALDDISTTTIFSIETVNFYTISHLVETISFLFLILRVFKCFSRPCII